MSKWSFKDNNPHTGCYLSDEISLIKILANRPIPELLRNHKNLILIPNFQDNESLDKSNAVLTTNTDQEIETHNIMGFIGMGSDMLTITSRFDQDQPWLLNYLLRKVLKINTINLKFGINNKKSYLDFLPFLFPMYLKRAMSKGLYKEYINKDYNDSNVKGIIDVKKHIKNNLPFQGKIYYRTREFNFDNPINQLIRHTIEYINLQYIYKGVLNDHLIKYYVDQIIDITASFHQSEVFKIIRYNRLNPIRNAYFKEYNELVRLCIQILTKEKISLEEESSDKAWGILFDGSWLWEEYINLLADDYYYHPRNRAKSDPQYLFERNIGLIFPDFISKDEVNCKIMDAKYKPSNNINSGDYHQILSYLFRFDSNEGLFVYPERSGEAIIKELKLKIGIDLYNQKSTTRISPEVIVKKIAFPIPVCDNEIEFEDFMHAIEEDFIDKIM